MFVVKNQSQWRGGRKQTSVERGGGGIDPNKSVNPIWKSFFFPLQKVSSCLQQKSIYLSSHNYFKIPKHGANAMNKFYISQVTLK